MPHISWRSINNADEQHGVLANNESSRYQPELIYILILKIIIWTNVYLINRITETNLQIQSHVISMAVRRQVLHVRLITCETQLSDLDFVSPIHQHKLWPLRGSEAGMLTWGTCGVVVFVNYLYRYKYECKSHIRLVQVDVYVRYSNNLCPPDIDRSVGCFREWFCI